MYSSIFNHPNETAFVSILRLRFQTPRPAKRIPKRALEIHPQRKLHLPVRARAVVAIERRSDASERRGSRDNAVDYTTGQCVKL
jgi:hypothetical protein